MDGRGQQLPFRIPINHIKVAPYAKKPVETRFIVKKILKHRDVDRKREYYVSWENKEVPNSWILGELFDGGQ